MSNTEPVAIHNTAEKRAELVEQGFKMVKKPNPVYMLELDYDAMVETNEGWLRAPSGHWLAHDPISGHIWPVAPDYVEQHYDPAPEELPLDTPFET